MKKRILAAALSATMIVSLAGCSSGGASSSAAASTDAASTDAASTESTAETGSEGGSTGGQKVGLSMPTQSLERWNRDGSYLDQQFKDAGYETVITYSDNDTNRQVSDIQNMIADGVDPAGRGRHRRRGAETPS